MRQNQYTIAPRDIHHHAAQLCQRRLQLQDHGPKCTAFNLLTVLFYAAARLISRAAACASLRDAPSDTAAHDALLATLPDYAKLQRRLNRALQGDLPHPLRRRCQPLAIDLVLIPYHGKPLHHPEEIYRSQAKSGTCSFHAYATAYVIRHGLRFTVALTWVRRGEALAAVIRRLLAQAAKAAVHTADRSWNWIAWSSAALRSSRHRCRSMMRSTKDASFHGSATPLACSSAMTSVAASSTTP